MRAWASWLFLLYACAGRGAGDRIDLGPRTAWHTAGAARVRDDGRISLAADGRGFVWKTVVLDVDRYPVVLVRTGQSLPRFRWTVAVQAGNQPPADRDQATPLLTKVAEEGGYVVPLQRTTGWRGTRRFVLLIALDGHARDWIEFADLEAVRFSDATPRPPQPTDPADGSTISPLALHYSWHQVANALAYDLEVSDSPGFAHPTRIEVTAPYLADRLPYLPEASQLLPPGTWFWRVRGKTLGDRAGAWSATQRFTIRPLAVESKVPELEISARHPLIVLLGDGGRLAEDWRAVPQALQPYSVLRVEALPAETLEAVVRVAQRDGVPLLVQVSGPHDYYGPVASRIPLPTVERLLGYSVVKGVYLCEQAFRVSPVNRPIMRHYAGRLVSLAAEHGKLVLWADGHWGRNLFIDVGLDRELLDTIRAHPATLIPIWKMNGALTPYSAHDAALGLWASGAVDHWGVQPERWYWYEAGFKRPNQAFWFKEGDTEDFPPTFYGEMALLGVSSGASVYSFEPGSDAFAGGGSLSEVARRVIFPLLSAVIQRRLIPYRDQVERHIRSVYLTGAGDASWSLDYGTLAPLYGAAYGTEPPFQIIPATGRYFWIPLVPPGTPPAVLARFPDRLHAGQFSTSEQARRHLSGRYPPVEGGEAWTVTLDSTALVLHNRENQDVDEAFSVSLLGTVRRISGRIGMNGWVAARSEGDALWMQVGGGPGRNVEVTLWADRAPRLVTASPPQALLTVSRDPRHGRYRLLLRPDGAAVDARVAF